MGMARKKWFGIVRHKFLRSSPRRRETIMVLHTNNTLARSSFADEATTVRGEEEEVKEILEVVGEYTENDAPHESSLAIDLRHDDDDEDEDHMLVMCIEHIAATRIQAYFRSHLARRAYRALRSLVKLQAVVRGVLERRQARLALECMHALARLQVTVRARQLLDNYPAY